MTRRRKAHVVTATVLAAASALVVLRRERASPAAEATPQSTIYSMLDTARDGDVDEYLAWYTGQMEASLKQAVAESGVDSFSEYLKKSNAAIKGVALMEPQVVNEAEVKVRVEYVYQDRNEVQQFYLEKRGGEWKIARVDSAERIKTLIPYGTPVQ
jgi:hypothetical protein